MVAKLISFLVIREVKEHLSNKISLFTTCNEPPLLRAVHTSETAASKLIDAN